QTVLYTVLEGLLRLLHPLTPFVTEEIWQVLPGQRPVATIMQAAYPTGGDVALDSSAVARMELVMEVVRAIRNIRGELDVAPGRKITVSLDCQSSESAAAVTEGEGYIRSLARVETLNAGVGIERPGQVATQVAGDVEVLIPLAGVIDLAEEETRLGKEIAKVQKDVDFFTRKLSNEKFVANAPAQVLEKDRAKLVAAEEKIEVLRQGLVRIRSFKTEG
ncbi:MAG: class I tRNA ligase family protein, partial [Geopsychrobacter sp.]|nr:class I tRNA ligase family protein [Geopsychrobacter sp.]